MARSLAYLPYQVHGVYSFTSTCCVMISLKCPFYGELFKITVCTIQLASVLRVARAYKLVNVSCNLAVPLSGTLTVVGRSESARARVCATCDGLYIEIYHVVRLKDGVSQ
jgi:hypothetical protein